MANYKKRSQFYRTLATMEDAGVPRVRALQQRHRGPFDRAARDMADLMNSQGVPLSEAMQRHSRLFSPFECSMVDVGERTGRLELVFKSLADWYELVGQLTASIVTGLFYPIILYHVAAVLLPAVSLLTKTATGAQTVLRVALLLGVPYAAVFFFFVVRPRLFPAGRGSAPAGALALQVPLLGDLIRKLNYARFFRAFGLTLRAGLVVSEASKLAATSCNNACLRQRFVRIGKEIDERGCTFTEAFTRHLSASERDSMAVTLMDTGEMAGAPDEMAERVARIYGEEAKQTLRRAATLLPILVYLAVAGCIAWRVIQFYGRLVGEMRELL